MRILLLSGSILSIIFTLSPIPDAYADTQQSITPASSYTHNEIHDVSRSIQNVVEKQLRAFRERKSYEAYAYASQDLKDQYRNEDHFMTMIKITHRAITSHVSYKFLDYSQIGDQLVQKVRLTSKDGSEVTALIHLQDIDGKWFINSYTLLDAKDAQPI